MTERIYCPEFLPENDPYEARTEEALVLGSIKPDSFEPFQIVRVDDYHVLTFN